MEKLKKKKIDDKGWKKIENIKILEHQRAFFYFYLIFFGINFECKMFHLLFLNKY